MNGNRSLNKDEKEIIKDRLEKKTDLTAGKKMTEESKYAYRNDLSKRFYDFLSGKTTKLPNFKSVNSVIRKKDDKSYVISVGCGLFTMFDGSRLYIRYEEPVSNNINKIEEIYSNNHIINLQTNYDKILNKKIKSSFDKTRILVFKNYLKQYLNYVKENEIEKSNLKSK